MSRRFGLLSIGAAVLSSIAAAAVERPTPEFQGLMKSNAAIVDLVGGNTFAGATNIDSGTAGVEPAIRLPLKAKDFDAILKDAATLRENFAKIETFWTERKVEDAVSFSKAAVKSIGEIETAAKAQDATGVTNAQVALANACRNCHLAHRVVM